MDISNAVEILGYATYLKNENDTLKAELAKYKRALELACEDYQNNIGNDYYEILPKRYLQQAEKEG